MTHEDDIRQLLLSYEGALNGGDADLALSLYTRDGISMAQGLPTLSGIELRDSYHQFVLALKMDVTFTIDEIVVANDTFAYALTRSNGTQTVVATGESHAEANREVFLLRNDGDGWKISRYLFNTFG